MREVFDSIDLMNEYTPLHLYMIDLSADSLHAITGKRFETVKERYWFILDLVGKIVQGDQGYCIRNGKIVECDGIGLIEDDYFIDLCELHQEYQELLDMIPVYDDNNALEKAIEDVKRSIDTFTAE
ncbi:MAG: hypothetical protein ACRDCE_22515 [Cetobacterium sp.]|uniref:hypothetical protein n=1 Tax=Cetobacterium sp. TaxID=2071632 RepID=UPI003EE48F2C